MGIVQRKSIVAKFAAFTTGLLQRPIDRLNRYIADTRRRVDTVSRKQVQNRWYVLGQLADGNWEPPYFSVDNAGDLSTLFSKFVITQAPYTDEVSHSSWSGNLPEAKPTAPVCFIKAGHPVISGGVYIYPKDALGDKVITDTYISVIGDITLGEGDATVEADEESKTYVPGLGDFYTHWIVKLGATAGGTCVVTPEELEGELAGHTTFSSFFTTYYAQASSESVLVIDPSLTNYYTYSFMKKPINMSIANIADTDELNELLLKLKPLFLDDMTGHAEKGVYIVLKTKYSTVLDGADEIGSDSSRYRMIDGNMTISGEDLFYNYELATAVLNADGVTPALVAMDSDYVIPFAVRVDNDTVVMCDGTRIYRRSNSNQKFVPDQGSRRYYFTGTSVSNFNPEQVHYVNSEGEEGTIAPMTEEGIGYYEATTHLYSLGSEDKGLRKVWVNDTKEFTFGLDGWPMSSDRKPLLSVNRHLGFVGIGAGSNYHNVADLTKYPGRDLRGRDISMSGFVPIEDNLLYLTTQGEEDSSVPTYGERTGLLFGRGVSGAYDADNFSIIAQAYHQRADRSALPSANASFPSANLPGYDGFIIATTSNRLVLGSTSDSFKNSIYDDIITYPEEKSMQPMYNLGRLRTYTVMQNRTYESDGTGVLDNNAYVETRCRSGLAGGSVTEALPGTINRAFGGVISRFGSSAWETHNLVRTSNRNPSNSMTAFKSHDSSLTSSSTGILQWAREGYSASMKVFAQRELTSPPVLATAEFTPTDILPGESALRIRNGEELWYFGIYPVSLSTAEITSNERTKGSVGHLVPEETYNPRVLAGTAEDALSLVFAGVNGATSGGNIKSGMGLTVYVDPTPSSGDPFSESNSPYIVLGEATRSANRVALGETSNVGNYGLFMTPTMQSLAITTVVPGHTNWAGAVTSHTAYAPYSQLATKHGSTPRSWVTAGMLSDGTYPYIHASTQGNGTYSGGPWTGLSARTGGLYLGEDNSSTIPGISLMDFSKLLVTEAGATGRAAGISVEDGKLYLVSIDTDLGITDTETNVYLKKGIVGNATLLYRLQSITIGSETFLAFKIEAP